MFERFESVGLGWARFLGRARLWAARALVLGPGFGLESAGLGLGQAELLGSSVQGVNRVLVLL